MIMRSLSLIFIWSILLGLAHGSTYSPAAGYYVCPEAGMSCMVSGCKVPFACRVIYNGFEKTSSDPQGRVVYTATRENANLSILTDDNYATEIACEAACECQMLDASGIGCVLDTPRVVAMVDEEKETVQGSEGDDSETNDKNTVLWAVGWSVGFLLLCVLVGAVWYQRQLRKDDSGEPLADTGEQGVASDEEEDVYLENKSVVSTNTDGDTEIEAMERNIENYS